MTNVQIKNVPEDTVAVLRERAERAGQSLQSYLLARLVDEAATPSIEEIFAATDADSLRSNVTAKDVRDLLRSDRARH